MRQTVGVELSAPGGEMRAAYAACERLTRSHYENFAVASLLLPRDLRPHMHALYAFCRGLDDLGDESSGDRLALLQDWELELRSCYSGTPRLSSFLALQATIRVRNLPMQPFLDLIAANRLDQQKSRYQDYAELRAYCTLSANPVGRLVLNLWGYRDAELYELADCTCTALQLANFWQDVARDLAMGRIYLPREDLERFGYSGAGLRAGLVNQPFRDLMRFEVERTARLFDRGLELVSRVAPSLRVALLLFSLGGMEVLRAIERIDYDVLHRRPALSGQRKACLILKALAMAKPWRGRDGSRA